MLWIIYELENGRGGCNVMHDAAETHVVLYIPRWAGVE
jgi:hypothetical protein